MYVCICVYIYIYIYIIVSVPSRGLSVGPASILGPKKRSLVSIGGVGGPGRARFRPVKHVYICVYLYERFIFKHTYICRMQVLLLGGLCTDCSVPRTIDDSPNLNDKRHALRGWAVLHLATLCFAFCARSFVVALH